MIEAGEPLDRYETARKPQADNLLEHELAPAEGPRLHGFSPAPTGDISALPKGLDGAPVVMLAHERDGAGAGYAIEHGQAGKRGAGAPPAASAGNLHPFGRGALPGFGQRRQDVGLIGGQPEIRPAKPP